MIGLLIKLVVCPVVVVLADIILPGINYTNLYQPIIVGVILAVLAHMMEIAILRKGSSGISNLMDFIAASLVIYYSQLLFTGARISIYSAMLAAFLLAITEYFQHVWLINKGKTKKPEDE
ncbi:DUF2512 family protein [Clostridium formicaceticum]|uniref:DUF2512 domain-containing protein n=1 Tax=Clostridium formicaceticum TaxID=1497 RepID=A0AAC9RHS1_9CLOT|nr:DUF2512 family protein [Clostridium formicaceticum]AOY76796.1 hypothetical protein BJL90_13600 [Clostridium formicaceticum]ARE87261.1 hypothetical protein CLFO_16600 [Clostridium formicaceticum]